MGTKYSKDDVDKRIRQLGHRIEARLFVKSDYECSACGLVATSNRAYLIENLKFSGPLLERACHGRKAKKT